jgi:hypothetical protein
MRTGRLKRPGAGAISEFVPKLSCHVCAAAQNAVTRKALAARVCLQSRGSCSGQRRPDGSVVADQGLIRSLSERAMLVSSSHVEGGCGDVWLRVRILNSLVLSLRTTVRAIRDSLREAAHVFSASRRIIGSVSESGTSRSNVSSAETDCVGLSGTTGFSSIPRAN